MRIDGNPAKAAQTVVPGTTVRVRQEGFDRTLEVTRLIAKRVGAPVAQQCYIDHTPARPRVVIPQVPIRDRGAGRPTKRDRREMERLRGR